MAADRTAPTPAPVAVPEDAVVAGLAARREYRENRRRASAVEIGVDEVHHILTAAAPHMSAPRPEPVVASLPSEAGREALAHLLWREQHVEWARSPIDPWDTMPEYEKVAGYRMADAVLAAGYRMVPEDGEERPCLCGTPGAADGWCPAHGGALAREASLAQHVKRLAARLPEDDEDTVRAVDALSVAREQIRARRIHFRELGAEDQYLNALDDAFGLVSNLWRSHGGEGR